MGRSKDAEQRESKIHQCYHCGKDLLTESEVKAKYPAGPFRSWTTYSVNGLFQLEDDRNAIGVTCARCGRSFCVNCMQKYGEPHPSSGGLACLKCGGRMTHFSRLRARIKPVDIHPRSESQIQTLSTSAQAKFSLLLGIAALLLGTTIILGAPLGIAAFFTGRIVKQRAIEEGNSQSDERNAQAGMILGVVGVLISVAMLVFLLVAWLMGSTAL
jgi:transcription elongation factor Elf1